MFFVMAQNETYKLPPIEQLRKRLKRKKGVWLGMNISFPPLFSDRLVGTRDDYPTPARLHNTYFDHMNCM